MKHAVLALTGRYCQKDLPRFKHLLTGVLKIAVDGGYRLFERLKITPDLLVGDFDSLKHTPKNLPQSVEIIRVPVRKNVTDTELALNICAKRGISSVTMIQPGIGDVDHFLGNVMLGRLTARMKKLPHMNVRLVGSAFEIDYLHDGSATIKDCAGTTVSLLPLSSRVVYSCRGTDYRAERVTLRPGQTLSLRNRITSKRATFTVEGEALLIRQVIGKQQKKRP